jgi:hypothetical protein
MSILAALLGKENPAAQWAAQNRGWLGSVGAGLGSGTTFQEGLANAAQMGPQGQRVDDAYRVAEAEKAERAKQINQTAQYLAQTFPDLAEAVNAGMPMDAAWNEAMKRSQPGYGQAGGDERFFGNIVPMQGPDGKTVLGQVSNEGRWQPLQGADGMSPAPTTKTVDTGTEIITTDIYGNELYRTPKQNRAAAAETAGGTVEGRNAAEMAIQAPVQQANLQRLDAQTDNVIQTIDKATDQASWDSTGVIGQALGAVGGTKAFDLRQTAMTIKANLGFAELQAMRDASPTGGALGQVAVQELESLQSTLASLNPDQSEEQLRKNLKTVRDLLEKQKVYRRAAAEAKFGGAAPAAPAAPGGNVTSTGIPWSFEP